MTQLDFSDFCLDEPTLFGLIDEIMETDAVSPTMKPSMPSPSETAADLGQDWSFNEVFQELTDFVAEPNDSTTLDNANTSEPHNEADIADDVVAQLHDNLMGHYFQHGEYTTVDGELPIPLTIEPLESLLKLEEPLESLLKLEENSMEATISEATEASQKTAVTATSRGRKRKARKPIAIPKAVVAKPHETSKQAVRRVKNNVASKDFRSRRKSQLDENLGKMEQFEKDNKIIKLELEAVEEVVRLLKEGLIQNAKRFSRSNDNST